MKSKKNLIILTLVIAISLIGVTYAFFDYYKLGTNQKITAGKVNLILNNGTTTINRGNIFPETVEKARSRTDNFITFTVSGENTTTNQDIYYEIMLNEGDSETGMTRFNPEDLVFDLVELNDDGTEGTYLVNAMSYSDFNAKRIWVNTVDRNNATVVNKTYKLRMWLSEDVLISDSNPNANYKATGYENYYASVKVSVYGDFVEKSIPYNYMVNLSSVTAITDQKANISEVHFISLSPDEINTRVATSTINADVTDSTKGGNVKAWLETDATDTTKYILYVASDGTTYFPSDCSSMFNGFSSVTNFNFENISTVNVTNMNSMFVGCAGLTSLDLSVLDMSNVTVASSMLQGCTSLTSINVNNWNLTSLANMHNLATMFSGCSLITSLSIDGWKLDDTFGFVSFLSGSSVTSLEITNFDLSGSTTMYQMFAGCSFLTSLNFSDWDTSNVTNMYSLFGGCSNLTSLDVSSLDTSSVTNMGAMFGGCSKLTTLDLNNFNTRNVTNMSSMFNGCSGLTTLELSGFTFDAVTNSGSMFYNMSDTVNVTVGGTVQQNWILGLTAPDNRPEAWTTSNVVLKSSVQ